jgi:hypothetical protein
MRMKTTLSFVGKILATALLSFLPFMSFAAEPDPRVPKSAPTVEAIIKAIDPLKGFGQLQTARFDRGETRVMAVWYCPFSGRAASFLRVYYFDPVRREWIQFVDRLIEGCFDLSAELPVREPAILFRNPDGKIVLREIVPVSSPEPNGR